MCEFDWTFGRPDIWLRIILGVLMWVFLDEVSIGINRLSKADCSPQCGWVSSNQSKARKAQEPREGEFFPSAWPSWSRDVGLLLPLDSDSEGNLHHRLSWVSSLLAVDRGLLGQFLIINLCIYIYISIYLHHLLVLWKTYGFRESLSENNTCAELWRIRKKKKNRHKKSQKKKKKPAQFK